MESENTWYDMTCPHDMSPWLTCCKINQKSITRNSDLHREPSLCSACLLYRDKALIVLYYRGLGIIWSIPTLSIFYSKVIHWYLCPAPALSINIQIILIPKVCISLVVGSSLLRLLGTSSVQNPRNFSLKLNMCCVGAQSSELTLSRIFRSGLDC